MKSIISMERIPNNSAQQTFRTTKRDTHRLLTTTLAAVGALVALWGPTYLSLLDNFGGEFAARSEAFEWLLVMVAAFGLGSVLYLAWQDTNEPTWRAAHKLPPI
jgi:hypothetical protein